MSTKISMENIARELGISKNTVSLVFRNIPGVNEQTRARVIETADRLGYTYQKSKMASSQNSTSICIVIPFSARDSSSFFSHIQFGIESEAKKHQINSVITYYDDSFGIIDVPLCIKEGLVSGIITLGRVNKDVFEVLNEYKLPMVMVDNYYEDTAWDYILSDNISGGFIATKHLIENGHKEIGFLGGINLSVSFYDRFIGYKKAMEQHSIPVNSNFVINSSFEAIAIKDLNFVSKELQSLAKLPSAFFCCNDIEAVTLIKALASMGIKVPEDVSVIGFDDIDLAKNFYPELTTMKVSTELMGIKAVQRLFQVVNQNDSIPEKLMISVSLVKRQSVKSLT